jgi:ABC-type microcin C transport system duplicated ATPase subunit YejF
MTSLAILRLLPTAGRIITGSISLDGCDLLALPENEMRRLRGSQIALIPQDPLTALNPVYTIGNQLNEVLMLHQGLSKADATKRSVSYWIKCDCLMLKSFERLSASIFGWHATTGHDCHGPVLLASIVNCR